MKLSTKIRGAAMVSLLAIPMLTTGCGLFTSQESGQIDPPQQTISETDLTTTPGQIEGTAVDEMQTQITFYLKDRNNYIAPVSLNVPRVVDIAKQTLKYMVEDGEYKDLLPSGFTAILPKGTQIKGISLDKENKLATVDFSKEFTEYNPQDERKILEALTYTLTGFTSVQQVKIRVEGKELREMPVDGTPLDEPLTRGMGINLETVAGIDFGQTVPVTVYFMGHTEENADYFVPVTRLIQRTDDLAQAAVQQLIQGPSSKSQLTAVVDPSAQVLEVKQQEGLITVNLNGQVLGPDDKVPSETLESVILSLTENTETSKVQIQINGKSEVNGSDDKSYSKPVARPTHVNPVEL